MPTPEPQLADLLTQAFITTNIAAVALGIAAWRGVLKPSVLIKSPNRSVKLQFNDFLAVASLMLVGMAMASAVFIIPAPNPIIKAVLVIPSSLLMYALAMAYLCYRLTRPEHTTSEVSGDTVQSPARNIRQFGLGSFHKSHLKSAILAILLALPVVFATNSLMSLLTFLMGHTPPQTGHELLTWFNETDHKLLLLGLLMISVTIIAPIMEEIVYRGLVQTWLITQLGKRSRWLVLFIAGCIFASVHLASVPFEVLPALFLLGIILGWLYETTSSLWPGMIVHALFNAINLTLALLIS